MPCLMWATMLHPSVRELSQCFTAFLHGCESATGIATRLVLQQERTVVVAPSWQHRSHALLAANQSLLMTRNGRSSNSDTNSPALLSAGILAPLRYSSNQRLKVCSRKEFRWGSDANSYGCCSLLACSSLGHAWIWHQCGCIAQEFSDESQSRLFIY